MVGPPLVGILVSCGALVGMGIGGPNASGPPYPGPGSGMAGGRTGVDVVGKVVRSGEGKLGGPSLSRPCGALTGKPVVDRALVIWEENHDFSSVIANPQAPEINKLADRCGLATGYEATTHPSLPNYMEMTSGQDYSSAPWDTDCSPQGACTTSATSVFSELGTDRWQWRSYAEGMESNCGLVTYGDYAARHNPAVYYTNIRRQCEAWDEPIGTPNSGPLHQALVRGPTVGLTTVTPDLQDDMHDGTVAQADNWLAGWVPRLVASPAYRSGHLAVIIVWDEGGGSGNVTSHVPLIVMSASTPAGTRSSIAFNDFSVLRTICELTGVASPGHASSAASLVGPFRL